MSRKATSPEHRLHQAWMGLVQPTGLLVSIPALEKAQCHVQTNVLREQAALRALLVPRPDAHGAVDPNARVLDLPAFTREVLGWEEGDLAPPPDSLAIALPEHGEVLRPDLVVGAPESPLALVTVLPTATPLDQPRTDVPWRASPQARIERLCRESGVPIGIVYNASTLRLVYAPRGETAGHATFPMAPMAEPRNALLLSALVMLLGAQRLFNAFESQRLPAILKDSRRYQAEVSTRLAGQVLAALHALLRGFEAADRAQGGNLLGPSLHAPGHVYGGLLATLMRLVFLLFAEDQSLLSQDPLYIEHYAVTALFEKLREDAARHPDTMHLRYGAWPRLCALFRMVHAGASHGPFRLPARYGRLFDPDAFPFLEGRALQGQDAPPAFQPGARVPVPRISDGTLLSVLENLLSLDGERLSYRALDVEQIGSVYEAIMGFTLERATEPSIALRPDDVVIGLASLLRDKPQDRLRTLSEKAGVKLPAKSAEAVQKATTLAELTLALEKVISPRTPEPLPEKSLYFQPTEERRRSGSHYTPRALTEPIVATTLRPIFESLGPSPRPEQILDLKVCDPAMGSGAFLVAACRALAEKLVDSWQEHGMPDLPADEDALLHARRLVAQTCLYGVDKNPFAVDLAKLSLWLVTLAKDHPFTFIDHALRQGDSLVGLTLEQLNCFSWVEEKKPPLLRQVIARAVAEAEEKRRRIHALADSDDTQQKRDLLDAADHALDRIRHIGNLVIDAFFGRSKDKDRKSLRLTHLDAVDKALGGVGEWPEIVESVEAAEKEGKSPPSPFHWQIEFPEVFSRENGGFDAFVGNPPFAGKNTLLGSGGEEYLEWLKAIHEGAHGNADLVAHFFRRAFVLLRKGGTFGLIATNTIAQGDTRGTGLRWICLNGGVIYDATRRYKWPGGAAAVVVSIVHVAKKPTMHIDSVLDGRPAERVSAFLFHRGSDNDPSALVRNARSAFIGSYVLGAGFTFDDTSNEATPIAEMRELISRDPKNAERIFPYLGGEDLNSHPTQSPSRHVINFAQMSEEEARQWPDLFSIVEVKVRPLRIAQKRESRARYWWRFGEVAPALYDAIRGMTRVLANSQVSAHMCFAFQPPERVFSHTLNVFLFDAYSAFAILQSRSHEIWARFFASSLEDRLRYTPTDCFETFPFPPDWEKNASLEEAGKTYYEFRASLMADEAVRAELMDGLPPEGLTATYNRFHDPDETLPGILRLRELHAAMDRAVLDAYGFTDLTPTCDFLLDYEDPESDEDDPSPRARRKKKPWRYRWPDDLRDDILSRLLSLNAARAAEESLLAAEPPPAAPKKPRANKKPPPGTTGPLFDCPPPIRPTEHAGQHPR
ncbi:MAG: DNA methyltransferase [Polyangiaceae bacterium]